MFFVVVLNKLIGPDSGVAQASEALRWQRGVVFRGSHDCFRKGVVVAHAWPGVRWRKAQELHQCDNGSRFQGATVVAM